MSSPVERLRRAVEAWRRDEAIERVWRWRGAPEASSASEVIDRHDWLCSRSAQEDLAEAVALGLVRPEERGALALHLSEAAAERELAGARDRLRALSSERITVDGRGIPIGAGIREILETPDPRRRAALSRALETLLDAELPALLDARARADEAAAPSAPGEELVALAREILDRTAAAADEAVAIALREASAATDRSWADLASGSRTPANDPFVSPRDRWRRIARGLAALGIERDLEARVRVDTHHASLSPRARVAAIAVPNEIRIAPSPLELGVGSELAASEALGRALALALTSPGLPVELRRPVGGGVGRAFGGLLTQLLADPVFLRRGRDLERTEAERLSRAAARLLVLELRLDAIGVLTRAGSPRERVEQAVEALRHATSVVFSPPIAALVAVTPSSAAARLAGRLAGLAASVGLRDRFDEDWFRNPRADEPLRAGAARGASLTALDWCAEELRVSLADGVARLIEISG